MEYKNITNKPSIVLKVKHFGHAASLSVKSFITMKAIFVKLLATFLLIVVGYAVATYQASRSQLSDEINDVQREISISSRLLSEYASTCNSEYSSFFAYVLHSIDKYELLIGKAKQFPFYFENNVIDEHKHIIFSYRDGLQQSKKIVSRC